MTGTSRLATAAAGVVLVVLGVAGDTLAQHGSGLPARAGTRLASMAQGSIDGIVNDDKGSPVAGAMVSAIGPTNAFAVTDRNGRFELRLLTPGAYQVRAHLSGFVGARAQNVDVPSSGRATYAVSLRRDTTAPAVLAAGFGALPAETATGTSGVEAQDDADAPLLPGHIDHTEAAWRIRHARRGVLKNETGASGTAHSYNANSFFADIPFSGQVNLLTTGSFDRYGQLLSPAGLGSGVAYIGVGAPAGDNAEWTVRGALTQADISSWIVAGSYLTREEATHKYNVGLSYSTQRYDGGNPLTLRDLADGTRNAAELYGFDTYTVSRFITLDYGARYTRYDYLDQRNLLSPRVEMIATAEDGTRLSALVSRRAVAPGAEEFLPPGDNGIWLPPQRTFSSLEPGRGFDAERTTHVSVGMARDIGRSTLTFTAFRQQTDGQLATAFGGAPDQNLVSVGHYVVGNVGDAEATGGTVALRTAALGGRVNSSVAYSLATGRLTPEPGLKYVLLLAPSAVRPETERVHDLSTTIEADVPETSTRVLVLYRASNAFARPATLTDGDSGPGFDARFDVQVRQSLPFLNFTSARWEALIAVRNFFREVDREQSIYDELLVVRPPKRLVGGVTLHF
jgi:Carboxypeptidase regulatory-like domain/TonB dependent receptor